VLDGEVAVPCNLQPAIAGSIAMVRQVPSGNKMVRGDEVSIHRNEFTPNPVRPGREQR